MGEHYGETYVKREGLSLLYFAIPFTVPMKNVACTGGDHWLAVLASSVVDPKDSL